MTKITIGDYQVFAGYIALEQDLKMLEQDLNNCLIENIKSCENLYNCAHHRSELYNATTWSATFGGGQDAASDSETCWKILQPRNYLGTSNETPKKDRLCRACLNLIHLDSGKTYMAYNIFNDAEFTEKLQKCVNMPIAPWDEYPHSMCDRCRELVLDLFNFINMCRNSLITFNNMIANQIEDISKSDTSFDCLTASSNKSVLMVAKDFKAEHFNVLPEEIVRETFSEKTPSDIFVEPNSNLFIGDFDCLQELVEKEFTNMDILENKGNVPEFTIDKNISMEIDMDRIIDETTEYLSHEYDRIEVAKTEQQDQSHIKSKKNANGYELTQQTNAACNTKTTKDAVLHIDDENRPFLDESEDTDIEEIFKCKHCPKTYNKLQLFENHLCRKHPNESKSVGKLFKCDIGDCNKVYSYNKTLNQHKRLHHKCKDIPRLQKANKVGRRKYICDICGRLQRGRASLAFHKLSHVDKSQWPCVCDVEGCSKRFKDTYLLNVHKKRHAGIKEFQCPHCDMRKTTKFELKQHMECHNTEYKYPCSFCSKRFKKSSSLELHLEANHNRKDSSLYKCSFCQCQLASSRSKKLHELTHSGEKSHKCDACGKAYYTKDSLAAHKITHKGPFNCVECGKKYKSPHILKKHIRTHLNAPKPFACDECDKTFQSAFNLRTHKMLHVKGVTPFKCEICGQGFRWPGAYYVHKKKHNS